MTRRAAARKFLATTDWHSAEVTPLAGDASNRTYFRLLRSGHAPAVLMDSPPEKGEDVRPFVSVARHLTSHGLSAPRILASDEAEGFLILEDLGDALYARVLEQNPAREEELYVAAIEALVELHSASPLPVAPYDAQTMGPLAGLAAQWYAGQPERAAELSAATQEALLAQEKPERVLALRDYHAENLLWLPNRSGAARVGLLDFQDARMGQRTYDLASLLKDARRDVSPATQAAATDAFASLTGISRETLLASMAAQSAQRNLRILGVFARLSLHFGKTHYIDLIPRVWRNLQDDLSHPALSRLRGTVMRMLPEPTPHLLNDLKARCGTIPSLA
ncbi:MAG: phosphotransferase [Pseudomonadota bacterium]